MDQEEFWDKLDKSDVEQVQQTFDLGRYDGNKKRWAEAWLKKQQRITPWYETWQGKALIALAILIIGAALSQLLFA